MVHIVMTALNFWKKKVIIKIIAKRFGELKNSPYLCFVIKTGRSNTAEGILRYARLSALQHVPTPIP